MNELAKKYVTKIEGFIPDLNTDLDDDNDGLRDAIYDFACDHIYDREQGVDVKLVREAALDIAHHYCGKEEDHEGV
ncbi:MAG: hypothetical protein KAJ19_28935 [Gammaproteobacteria bacterium]|nr:hypothetical protein [Gammaproteobacteria bacterium]